MFRLKGEGCGVYAQQAKNWKLEQWVKFLWIVTWLQSLKSSSAEHTFLIFDFWFFHTLQKPSCWIFLACCSVLCLDNNYYTTYILSTSYSPCIYFQMSQLCKLFSFLGFFRTWNIVIAKRKKIATKIQKWKWY